MDDHQLMKPKRWMLTIAVLPVCIGGCAVCSGQNGLPVAPSPLSFCRADSDVCRDRCVADCPHCCPVPILSHCGETSRDPVNGCRPLDNPESFIETLWDDASAVATMQNAGILTIAGGGAVAIRQNLDGQIRANTARNPQRWGQFGSGIGELGNPYVQVPTIAALAGFSRWSGDEELRELSDTITSAYALNLVATTGLKLASNTKRPDRDENNGRYGFPSFHTSSSFTIATVLDERYGWEVGLPAYALASAVGWTRIDQRDHDLSDVLFGATLGYVIGKSVARNHFTQNTSFHVSPYIDPTNAATGVMIESTF
jgi:membrane-associated phospholipid phosphatase